MYVKIYVLQYVCYNVYVTICLLQFVCYNICVTICLNTICVTICLLQTYLAVMAVSKICWQWLLNEGGVLLFVSFLAKDSFLAPESFLAQG